MLTFQALLRDATLGLRLLNEGDAHDLRREVLWVHTTELPDPSPYLRPGELVLTNGVWLGDCSASAFLAALVRRRPAGLVFGLTDQLQHVPGELRQACAAHGVNLASLPVTVPFTAVTSAAAALQYAARQESLLKALRRGDALAEAISRGGGAAGVLEVVKAEHDLVLAVVDRHGQLLASVDRDPGREFVAAAVEALGGRPPPLGMTLADGQRHRLFLVHGAMGDVAAGLFCLVGAGTPDELDRRALEQAARFLSLEVAKQQAVQAIELRFSGEVLEMILSGGVRLRELAERLRPFGVDPAGRTAILALGSRTGLPPAPGTDKVVRSFFADRRVPFFSVPGSHGTVLVLSWRDDEESLSALARALCRTLTATLGDVRPVVGVGDIVEDQSRLRESLVRAREACRVLEAHDDGPPAATFREVGTHTMLLGLHDRAVLSRFAADELTELRAHDAREGTQLETTLRAFLERDGQWGVTAADLFVHVNTLRNRMARIGRITGRDMSRFTDRVDLYLALKADDMS